MYPISLRRTMPRQRYITGICINNARPSAGERTLARTKALDGRLGPQRELAGLHHQSQAGIDALQTSLLLQGSAHDPA